MSFSSQTSNSSSTPEVVSTPENSILDQLSGVAAGLANQMYGWAQGVFAQTSQVTNQAVGNFFNVSQKMLGLSNNLTDQYNNLFAPENAQLVADANSYASPSRMAADMGQAGATQAQAGDAAIHNSEEALKSYGIDPSSGRYAALDKVAGVQNAANIAGAENTQRNTDIATGQRLRSEAVQVGAQLPSAISNVNNTALAANTGASNATLANANTGRNLMSLPNDFLKTATGIPLSPVAQRSQSSSQGASSSPSNPNNGGRSGGGGGGDGSGGAGGVVGRGGPAWMPQHTGYQSDNTGNAARGGAQPGSKVTQLPDTGGGQNWTDPSGNNYDLWNNQNSPNFDYLNGGGQGSMDVGQAGTNPDIFGGNTGVGNDPFADPGFGQTYGDGGAGFGDTTGNTTDPFGSSMWDPNQNQAQLPTGWQDPTFDTSNTNWGDTSGGSGGGGSDPFSYSNTPGADTSGTFDPNSGGGGYGDYTAPSDTYDPGGAYAQGGVVRSQPRLNMTRGGNVSPSASPSHGQRVDDIKANVNAGEFVMPKDVVAHKGSEFFQKLIAQSRKARMIHQARQRPMMAR